MRSITISFLFLIVLFSVKAGSQEISEIKEYTVNYIKQAEILLDGRIKEGVWDSAEALNDFSLPWENADVPMTKFRTFYDNENLYLSFECGDTTMVVLDSVKNEEEIENEDRVEIYFALDRKLSKYYCAEIDPKGRVLDYEAKYHRQFNFLWNWPKIETSASIKNNGYIIEALIPLEILKELDFPVDSEGAVLYVGVYRADFEMSSKNELIPHWLAWIDPHVVEPDYHVSSSFGEFHFNK